MIAKRKVLVVSVSKDTYNVICNICPSSKYSLFLENTITAAKNKLRIEKFDFVIIQTPLKDEFGVKSAKEISRTFGVCVILMVKSDIYDQVTYQVQDESIFVISVPTNKNMIYQSISMVNTFVTHKELMEIEVKKLKKKIADDKIINHVKLLLIENYHWSEQKAHHYIEKMAMDNSKTKVEIAKSLLERMDQS